MYNFLEDKGKDQTEQGVFNLLFYTLITKNDYYTPILEYADRMHFFIEELAIDLAYRYENYDFSNPYKYLDNITNYITKHPDTTLEVSEILDCIAEYDWD